ncbi:MAG TPA: ScpA family protein [Gaiellaceae bacterium]
MIVRELELDLDAFEGPFDLLLTLVLKDELELREIDVAGIVLAFLERLSEREELDLEACGEFLVLIAALLELKARGLFPEEAAELAELEPEAAAEELARRLAEYRRMKQAAGWLRERLETEGGRYFRLGPAPLAPKLETPLAPQQPERLAQVIRLLAVEPPQVSLAHMALRFPPVSQFLDRFRAVLRRRSRFDFDVEVRELSRVEQAVAFLALLDLRRSGEIVIDQAAPFAPIRVARAGEEIADRDERTAVWTARSA